MVGGRGEPAALEEVEGSAEEAGVPPRLLRKEDGLLAEKSAREGLHRLDWQLLRLGREHEKDTRRRGCEW